jgi:hypothetical protein
LRLNDFAARRSKACSRNRTANLKIQRIQHD